MESAQGFARVKRFGETLYPDTEVNVRLLLRGGAELDLSKKVRATPLYVFPKKGRETAFDEFLALVGSRRSDVFIQASLKSNSELERHSSIEELIEDRTTKFQLYETQSIFDQEKRLVSLKAVVRLWDGATSRECSDGFMVFRPK